MRVTGLLDFDTITSLPPFLSLTAAHDAPLET
jgi:hypothetical protein